MAQENQNSQEVDDSDLSQKERQQIITENLTGRDIEGTRILEYQKKSAYSS